MNTIQAPYTVVIKADAHEIVGEPAVRQIKDGKYFAILRMSDEGMVFGRGKTEAAAIADARQKAVNY